MPVLGEIKKGWEVGYKGHAKRIWIKCPKCQMERWVCLRKGVPESLVCISCANADNKYSWKGGRYRCADGYVRIHLQPDDFFYAMAETGNHYVREHRLIMAKHLGRCLHSWEIVHHKNGIKDDNRIENLQLVSDDRHKQITILEMKINRLENRVTLLEAENVLLSETQRIVE